MRKLTIPRRREIDIVPNPVHYCDFTLDKGSKVMDLSGRGNHGVVYGATPVALGRSFDGVDDYVDFGGWNRNVGTIQFAFTNQATITTASAHYPVAMRRGDFIGLGSVTAGLTDELITVACNAGGRAGWCQSGGTIPVGVHLIDMRWAGTTWQIFLDGKEKPVTTVTPVALLTASSVLVGKAVGSSVYFTGIMHCLLCYEQALTTTQLAQNRTAIRDLLSLRGISGMQWF